MKSTRGGSTFGRKVAVALSGGVDSGVAAALVVKKGFKVAGFHMHLWQESLPVNELTSYGLTGFKNKCCSSESLEAARKTAHKLGIPFYIVDFEKIFKKRVVDYFLKEYGLGRTPNPCVMCNRFIKFGELLDYVKKLGYDYLATGHYARVVMGSRAPLFSETRAESQKGKKVNTPSLSDPPTQKLGVGSNFNQTADQCSSKRVPSPLYHLLIGIDKSKDQSYFLYNLTQKQLSQVMFPVGEHLKKEVVAMAKKWRLPVASRPESQEICFFPETDYRPFLKRQIPQKIIPGEVVDATGKVVGKHQGIPLYTIGQRHGFEIRAGERESGRAGIIPPYYVISKDVKKNQLIVGFGKEAEIKSFWVKNVHFIDPLTARHLPLNVEVRIRHQGELLKARIKRDKRNIRDKWVEVILAEGERGVSPGQAAVFYKSEEVLGGGTIAIDKGK